MPRNPWPSPRGAPGACVLLAALGLMCASCRLLPPDSPILRVPPLGEAWARSGFVSGWILDAGGERSRVEPGDQLELDFRAGRTEPLFLCAWIEGLPYAPRPLGTVWPHCAREAGLEATVAGGWVATVCSMLLRASPGLAAAVDWSRMERELAARLDDPWCLDPARAAERLAQGAFSVLDLGQPEAFSVSLPFEGPSPIDESPAAATPPRDAEGRLTLRLAAGQRRFLAPGLILHVAVDAEGAWTACLERAR